MTSLAIDARAPDWRKLAVHAGVLALAALFSAYVLLSPGLTYNGRVVLIGFTAAMLGWTLTRIEPAYIALSAALGMLLMGAVAPRAAAAVLGADVIWLLMGVFVIGAAFETSGLAGRLRDAALAGARTAEGVFWRMSAVLGLLTILIPSTSGRAALALPAANALFAGPEERAQRRAFALLIPIVILVTTSAALTGAGSHLLANDLLHEETGKRLSYLDWAIWGAPFAVAVGAASCFVVTRCSLKPEERRAPIDAAAAAPKQRFSGAEWKVLAAFAVIILLWSTTEAHALSISATALIAAGALTAPRIGVIGVSEAARAVNWRIMVLIVATLIMGVAMMESGAADWLVARAWAVFGAPDTSWAAIIAITLISVGAHLFIASHVARAAILTPPILAAAQQSGLDPAAAVFLGMAGVNYCLTLPVCSKALVLFADEDGGLRTRDLVRASALIAPIYIALMLACALAWWR